ncbi:MAG: TonB family protein [Armatimonadetes bacterium]|nr:TonB family protein [Armatimonadota bacterium]
MASRRRRKKNPLLTRIFVITVILHAIALPIAAHFGVFKNIKRGNGTSQIVMLTTSLKDQPDQPKEKQKPKQVKDTKKAPSGAKSASKGKSDNLPQPKVVTSGPANGAGGGGDTPSAESGSGKAGQVPNGGKTEPTKTEPAKPEPKPEPEKKPEPKKPDPPKPEPAKPEPEKKPEPQPKKIIEAVVSEAPQPEIPEDLRYDPLDKTLVVEAQIDTGGHPINVEIVTSTGIKELDDVGLETAKKYRFTPATIDGLATEQRVRFKIYFKVE